MELLYNPDRMPEEEIKATFVAREQLVDELVALVESQPVGAGVQHAVIIAPRGMGKTTVLLMVKFAIKDRGLDDRWQVVKFPEESYGVYDLADLWIETLNLLPAEAANPELRQFADSLKSKYPDNDELQRASYAALKDWRRKNGKRLLLLVENFDQILEQINDERDNARLRDALMNDDTIMILGCATTFFKEARAYDTPLYNFFKIYNLADLKFQQMQELLRRRAQIDRIADFEKKLKHNDSRLRALEYFTGGNPRLVLMLYRVVSHSDVTEVRRALEKLLDEVTPYYKAKGETLPPQQRKILDHIARVSSETNEGLMPGEIAAAVRLPPNQVSAQLKRLSELGYVRAANLRGRNSYYILSEPLYAIWHQMRTGHNAKERMGWLIGFLKALYTIEEMRAESSRLERRFRHLVRANHTHEAHDVLEHHRYLIAAMVDPSCRLRAMDHVICGHLELKDFTTLKSDLLANVNLADLSYKTLDLLGEAGLLSEGQVSNAKAWRASTSSQDEQFAEAMAKAALAHKEEKYEGALLYLDRALALKPNDRAAWRERGHTLWHLDRYAEAVKSFDRALKINPNDIYAWNLRGDSLGRLGHYEEALTSFDRALQVRPNTDTWVKRGIVLQALGRNEEALTSLDRALELKPTFGAWLNRGMVLGNMGRNEEALTSFDRALDLEPDERAAWNNRSIALGNLGRYEEALTSADKAIAIKGDDCSVWNTRGIALRDLGRYDDAVKSFDRALELEPEDHRAWERRGETLNDLGRYEDALASFDRALRSVPNCDRSWGGRSYALGQLGRYEEAIGSYDRLVEINPDFESAWYNRGHIYLELFVRLAKQEEYDSAKQSWSEAMRSGEKSENENWQNDTSEALLEIAKAGRLKFVRQLIAETGLEEPLFPLARAIDYLATGEEGLIEKLSPEVRGIVEEVVAKLRSKSPTVSQRAVSRRVKGKRKNAAGKKVSTRSR